MNKSTTTTRHARAGQQFITCIDIVALKHHEWHDLMMGGSPATDNFLPMVQVTPSSQRSAYDCIADGWTDGHFATWC
jgi:hypothetical protein